MARTPCPPVGLTVPQPVTWAPQPPGLLTARALVWRSHSRCSDDGRRVPSPCLSASLCLDRAFRLWARMGWACPGGWWVMGDRRSGVRAAVLARRGARTPGAPRPGPRQTSPWARAGGKDAGVGRRGSPGSREPRRGSCRCPRVGEAGEAGVVDLLSNEAWGRWDGPPPPPAGRASSVGSCWKRSWWVLWVQRLLMQEAGVGARGVGTTEGVRQGGPLGAGGSWGWVQGAWEPQTRPPLLTGGHHSQLPFSQADTGLGAGWHGLP